MADAGFYAIKLLYSGTPCSTTEQMSKPNMKLHTLSQHGSKTVKLISKVL
jgi:hypothetical protein